MTLSSTCPKSPIIARNASLILSAITGQVRIADGWLIPVAAVSSSTGFSVSVTAAIDVKITEAANASGSVGDNWAANVYDATAESVVVVSGAMNGKTAGSISLVGASTMIIAVDVVAAGRCIPPGFRERLSFSWTLTPMPPPTALRVAMTATFRASSVTSSFLGSPIAAMTTTGMVSILSLNACLYSDVDPLDQSVSPIGVAVGPELGQYYRGGVVVALSLYGGIVLAALVASFVLSWYRECELTAALALLHFPSVGMVIVGLFGQGLASCGTSLIRLNGSSDDNVLGVVSLAVCGSLVVWAAYCTTRGLQCVVKPIRKKKAEKSSSSIGTRFFELATWQRHWRDVSTTAFKKRHMMLIDDLSRPWWTAVELSSCLFQGAVLGIRENSLTVCRTQQWLLTVHTAAMAVGAVYFRPCGAFFSNLFLIMSKLGAFIVAFFILLDTLTLNDAFSTAAQIAMTVSTIIASCQTLVAVICTLHVFLPTAIRAVIKVLGRVPFVMRMSTLSPQKNYPEQEGRRLSSKCEDDEDKDDCAFHVPDSESLAGDYAILAQDVPDRNEAQGRLLTHRDDEERTIVELMNMQKLLKSFVLAAMPGTSQDVRLRLLIEGACAPHRSNASLYRDVQRISESQSL